MQIDIDEIRNGEWNGKVIYVCDYRQPDHNKKALRNVPPTKVLVRDKSEHNKTVYYSDSYFSPIGKNGKPLSKAIMLFDNTGFRSYTGNPLYAFDDELECQLKWNELIDEQIDYWENRKKTALTTIENTITNFRNMRGDE